MKSINLFAIIALELLLASPPPARATSAETAAEENSLTNNAKAFVDAFEKGDAKAIAAFWAEDGDYVDVNGRHLQGRPSIENAFKDFFTENKGLKLRIDVNSVRFVTPDIAIEDGITSVIPRTARLQAKPATRTSMQKRTVSGFCRACAKRLTLRLVTTNTCADWSGLLANGLMRVKGRKSTTLPSNGRRMVISSFQPRT